MITEAPHGVNLSMAPRFDVSGKVRLIVIGWLAGILVTGISGCGYPKIGAPAYELARTLCTVCNLRQADQLAALEKLIAERETAHEITARESQFLERIVATANQGNWNQAEMEARRLLRDQTE